MEPFDLQNELARSKINININLINLPENANKFLSTRAWDYYKDNKINDLNKKVDFIHQKIDKIHLNYIKAELDKKTLEKYVNEYNPRVNLYAIGCLSSTNFMVEMTANNNLGNFDNIINNDDINELCQYMFKFRAIKGDGECFYRSLIFSILENNILTNNIMQMKELLILYYEKISLDNKLVDEKDYLKRIKQMDINIVSEILYLIINQMENNKFQAYIILLKAFIYCSEFDFGIIYFTRYLIYEYISENENKIYSKEYPTLELGCLLPEQFVVDKGEKNEYLYDDYYREHLMHPKTFAEKIVVYVAPFVFNIRINILDYVNGLNEAKNRIKEDQYLNEKKNEKYSQAEINLLYNNRIHYDVYYKYNYYEDNKQYLDILLNKREDMALIANNEFQAFPEFIQVNSIKSEIKPNYDFPLYHENNEILGEFNPNPNKDFFNNNLGSEENRDLYDYSKYINNINNNMEKNINNEENEHISEYDKIMNDININSNNKNIIFKDNEFPINKKNMSNINNNIDNNFDYQDNDNALKEYYKIMNGFINNRNDVNSDYENDDSKNNEDKLYFNIEKNKNNNGNYVNCLECKKSYLKKGNIFDICNECLLGQLKPLIFWAFIGFLKDETHLINSEEKFKDLLSNRKSNIINQEDLSIYEAISKSKLNLKDILLNIRSNYCLYCGKENLEETGYFIILPCKCKICSINCFKNYIVKIKAHITLKNDNPVYYSYINFFSCYCGFIYNTKNILDMIKQTEKNELYKEKDIYQKYLINFWNWRCFLCKNNFEVRKDFCKVYFECDAIDKNLLYPDQKFKHLLCDECLYKYVINSNKIIRCNICEMEHKLVKFIKVNEYNEEMETIQL